MRFLTAGSVDDGKSTLIGRLLFDSQAILADQLDHLEKRAAGAPVDLSLLTDGLEAEREQGITIDVAYRYFATRGRKFIIADAPGHEQYTRNMVTAAAGSDAAVVLVDITKIDFQNLRRHGRAGAAAAADPPPCAAGPPAARAQHRVRCQQARRRGRPEQAFEAPPRLALQAFAAEAGISGGGIIPVSALRGDNVTTPLQRALVPGAPACCSCWNACPPRRSAPKARCCSRCSTWPATRPKAGQTSPGRRPPTPRVFWGRIAHGSVRAGDAVQVFPSGEPAVVAEVRRAGSTVASAQAGESAGIVLDRQLDISRGDWIASPGSLQPVQRFTATLAWLDTEPATVGRKYWVRHGNRWVQARIEARSSHRLDIHTLQPTEAHELAVNEIGEVHHHELQQPLPVEPYAEQPPSAAR